MINVIEKKINEIPVLEVVDANVADQALPLVVFYHGWTGCKEKVIGQGYELAKQGIRAIIPDALYHGVRQAGPFNEHLMEFWEIIINSLKEYPEIVTYYSDQGLVLPHQLGVAGLSMGGITTTALMASYPEINSAFCQMGTASPVAFAQELLKNLPEVTAIAPAEIKDQLATLAEIDLSLQPKKINGRPFHFWHGKKDSVVPYQVTRDFYEKHQGQAGMEQMTFMTSETSGHQVPYQVTVETAKMFAQDFKN